MTSVLKFLVAVAACLELITDQIKKYVERKEKVDIQNRYDAINIDPAGEFLRKFKRGQTSANTLPKPGERGNEP